MADKIERNYPDVVAHPLGIYATALVLGFVMDLILPTKFFSNIIRVLFGVPLIAIGVAVMALAIKEFRKAGTNIEIDKPAYALVKSGLYSITRNPIYIALSVLYMGLGLAADNLWILLFGVPAIYLINSWVIEPEEEYLQKKFGKEYQEYTSLVPRWF